MTPCNPLEPAQKRRRMVPQLRWPKAPMEVAQRYEQRHTASSAPALVLWASWAVQSLYYLDDLDQVQDHYPEPVAGHLADIIDIAHVRWSTSTAITALDLCAASLARGHAGWTSSHRREADLRDFQPGASNSRRRREIAARRGQLPPAALKWVDQVLADPRYRRIHGARNPFTHSWLTRTLSRGGGGGHAVRTSFRDQETGRVTNAREFVELARDLASDQVIAFLDVFDGL